MARMDFGCCQGICESQVAEIINNDTHVESRYREGAQQGVALAVVRQEPAEESASPKVRLRKVIRDFAHKVVGTGIQIEARSSMLSETADGLIPGMVRMDKRLSRLEIQTRTVSVVISLADVHSFVKGLSARSQAEKSLALEVPADTEKGLVRDDFALTVVQDNGPDLEMFFDSVNSRDQAYTCFKIFHMSVFSSMDSQSMGSSTEATVATLSPGNI